jgi:hypothetical protein
VFDSDFCAPVKHAENWLKNKVTTYGTLTDCPAFRRVSDYLISGRAREAILRLMRQGVRLEGSGAESPGIEQCRIMVDELNAMFTAPGDHRFRGGPFGVIGSRRRG